LGEESISEGEILLASGLVGVSSLENLNIKEAVVTGGCCQGFQVKISTYLQECGAVWLVWASSC
jgi:hypothetical protein